MQHCSHPKLSGQQLVVPCSDLLLLAVGWGQDKTMVLTEASDQMPYKGCSLGLPSPSLNGTGAVLTPTAALEKPIWYR